VSAHRGTPAECESRRRRWAAADSPPADSGARGWWGRWRPEGVGIGHAPVTMLRRPHTDHRELQETARALVPPTQAGHSKRKGSAPSWASLCRRNSRHAPLLKGVILGVWRGMSASGESRHLSVLPRYEMSRLRAERNGLYRAFLCALLTLSEWMPICLFARLEHGCTLRAGSWVRGIPGQSREWSKGHPSASSAGTDKRQPS